MSNMSTVLCTDDDDDDDVDDDDDRAASTANSVSTPGSYLHILLFNA